MARLNEPAPPVESLESLKRRFVRQNRDLARHNSQQSLKIRLLESELSRLRAENVVICEENIQLHTQVDDLHRGRQTSGDMARYAEQETIQLALEAKVKEFGALVHSLGDVNARSGSGGERKRRCKSEILAASNAERLSPGSRRLQRIVERSEASLMKQVEIDADTRMPAITEGASYPRRTLETTELQRLLVDVNNSDSPDFGPPPTTFFDREQPGDKASQPDTLASVNLERRRRRSTISRQPEETSENDTTLEMTTVQPESDSEQLLRVGAKRKWDSRHQKTGGVTGSKDEFRSSGNSESEEQDQTKRPLKQPATMSESSTAAKPAGRKVLAPKPVNNDPVVSPRKSTISAMKERPSKPARQVLVDSKASAPIRPAAKARVVRESRAIFVPKDEPQDEPIATTEIKLEPKTPSLVLDDIFSPPDSRVLDESVRPDTPPPMTTSAGGIEGPTGLRGTRRARVQVSYAEPSLNTKMRRAGDKMDAVAGAGRRSLTIDGPRRSTSVQPDVTSTQKDKAPPSVLRPAPAKQDQANLEEDSKVKVEAGTLETTANTLSARLKALVKPEAQGLGGPPSESVMQAATTNTRKRQSQRPSEMTAALRTLEATDVFDVTDSPSSTHSVGATSALVMSSSVSKSTLSRPTNRRQTLAASLASNSSTTSARPGSSGSDKATAPSKQASARSAAEGLGAKADKDETSAPRETEGLSRAERIAARRRSMML